MNDLQEKWVEALESGKYEQGNGFLHVLLDGKHKYCCLGIACEVMGVELMGVEGKLQDTIFYYGDRSGALGEYKQLGLLDKVGSFSRPIKYYGKTYKGLTYLNDDGVPFKEIAKIIRSNEELVFR